MNDFFRNYSIDASSIRQDKFANEIARVVAQSFILYDLTDIAVICAKASKDLRYCDILIESSNINELPQSLLSRVELIYKLINKQIKKYVRFRVMPKIRFHINKD